MSGTATRGDPVPTTALVASAVSPEVSGALQIYEQLKPLKDSLGVGNLTDQELQLFALVAKHTGLDPFSRQIYAVKRSGKVTHQTGIDGYRSIAERTAQYAGSDEATFEACDCGEEPKDHPKIARVVVHRILASGERVDQVGVARWHELYPGKGDEGFMWRKMPHGQLAKCAEAQGFRKAFPRTYGGVYIADEMQGGEIVEGEARDVGAAAQRPSARDRIAARRAETEAHKAPTAPEAQATDQAAAAPATAAEPPTIFAAEGEPAESGLTFIDLLRAAADSLDVEGPASDEQRDAILKALEGLPAATMLAGVRAIWPDAIADGKARLSASQAAAIVMTAGTTHPDEFRAAWQELAAA